MLRETALALELTEFIAYLLFNKDDSKFQIGRHTRSVLHIELNPTINYNIPYNKH